MITQALQPLGIGILPQFKITQAEQAAEKVGGLVGRGFSHDVSALDSSGVLTLRPVNAVFPSVFGGTRVVDRVAERTISCRFAIKSSLCRFQDGGVPCPA